MLDCPEMESKLNELLIYIKSNIDRLRLNGDITPVETNYFKWVYESSSYTDDGELVLGPAQGIYFNKPVWWSVATISKIIKETDQFNNTIKYFEAQGLVKEKNKVLEYFVGTMTYNYLTNPSLTDKEVAVLINNVLKELKDEELNCYADIELNGVTIVPEFIDITSDIRIRKITKEDVEKEISLSMFPLDNNSMVPYIPSSILHIKILTKERGKIQEFAEQITCLLRLFNVGSVLWKVMVIKSDYVSPFSGGKYTAGGMITSFDKYSIKENDTHRLKDFFDKFINLIPKNLYWHHGLKQDDLAIAYQRYCAALLEGGTIEKKIANIMAGLEKIFLKVDGIEVGYKLRVRVSRLFYFIGFDARTVKKNIRIGYDIRSIYAHGSVLTDKNKADYLEKNVEPELLFKELADYLRISMLILILIEYTNDLLIQDLEESLLDKAKEEQFIAKISCCKQFLLEH